MPILSYTLPYRERTRLFMRECAAQRCKGSEVCGFLISDDEGHLDLWFLENQNISTTRWTLEDKSITAVWNTVHSHGKQVVGTFHSLPVSEPIPIAGDLGLLAKDSLQLFYDVSTHQARLWRISNFSSQRVAVEVPLAAEQMSSENLGNELKHDWRFGA